MLEETPAPLPIIASETVQNEMSEEPSTPLYIAMIKNNSSKILKASMSLNGWQSWLVSQRQTFEFGPKSWKNLFFQNADKSFQLKIETDDGSVLYDSTLDTYFVLEIDKDCTNRKLKAIVEIASKTIVSKEHGRQREQLAVLAARENYYHILQVQNDATMEQIKHSYYRLVLLHHPNKNNNSVESKIAMQIIDEAYECLKNPESRKLYDKAVPTGPTAGVSSLISAPIAGASSLISVPIANVFAKPIPGEIADCVAAGGAGGILWGIEANVAEAFASGRWHGVEQIAVDIFKAILVSGVFEATAGSLAGLKGEGLRGHRGTGDTAADLNAGNIAGVDNETIRIVGELAKRWDRKTVGSAVDTGGKKCVEYCVEIIRTLRERIPEAVLKSQPKLPENIVAELAHEAINYEPHSKHSFVLFVNNGRFTARAIVEFRVGNKERKIELENCKLECLPMDAFNVVITFAVGMWPFHQSIKKWDRNSKRFVKPEDIEKFAYNSAPQRIFVVDGMTQPLAKVVKVYNEANEPVDS